MTDLPSNDQIDVTHIIVKPLYFGMLVNVVIPLVLLLGTYWHHENGGGVNHVGEASQTLLYLFVLLAVIHTGIMVWWREKLFKKPMIHRPEMFEFDFGQEYLKRCRPLFIGIASISLYGIIYYFITGRFTEGAIFVLISYVVFQLVRPRHGLVYKLLARQRELVQKGELLRD